MVMSKEGIEGLIEYRKRLKAHSKNRILKEFYQGQIDVLEKVRDVR